MRILLTGIIIFATFIAVAVLLWIKERKHTDNISGKIDSYYPDFKEKRKSVRFDKRLDVVCKVTERADNHWSVFSKDVSGEGICLCLPEMLPQDAVIDLEISMPDKRPINVRGRVIWIKAVEASNSADKRQFNAGIEFVRVDAKDKKILTDFIKESLKTAV